MTYFSELFGVASTTLRRASRGALVALALLFTLGGCRQLNVKDGFPCSAKGECPSPYQCAADQRCYKDRGASDGGAGDSLNRGGSSQDGSSDQRTGGHAAGGMGGATGTATGGSTETDGGSGSDDAGNFGDAGAKSLDNGQACGTSASCKSGFCVDGVCCDTKCDGACVACTAALTSKDNGTCAPVNAGTDPHETCAASAPATCGNDGLCDGAGACRKYGSNQSCGEPSCSGSTFVSARSCDGKGACGAATSTPCGSSPCTTTGCAAPCTKDAECTALMAGSFCDAGTCKAKKPNGDTCGGTTQCLSGFCVDGVCCESACTGACLSCLELATGQKSGSCQPVQAGKDPDEDCPTDLPTTCGRDGTCDGKGACRKYGSTTKCADASCSGTIFTPVRTCAAGACAPAAPIDCGQNQCAIEGCRVGCSNDTECSAGAYCSNLVCAAKKANGTACVLGKECSSNACVDGKCCETACTGKCYACANAKTGQNDGKCAPIAAGADPDNECADSDASTCATEGKCDGAGACRLWSKGTQCAAGSCNTSGNYVSVRTCDGLGTCGAATTSVCGANICTPTGCNTTCSSDAQCTGSSYCAGTSCAAKKASGAACPSGKGNECLSGSCVDGFCCDTKCDGKCVACSTALTGQANGKCAPIPAGMGQSECPFDATKPCGINGCNGAGACQMVASGSSCGTASCTNTNQFSSGKTCDGAGNCNQAPAQPCAGGLICGSTSACRTTCRTTADCTSGNYCSAGKCLPKKASGALCTSGSDECSSGTCSVDGYCCNSLCGDLTTCQSCSTGTCSFLCSTGTQVCVEGACQQCDGTSGNWMGCRGTGCLVCTEFLAGYTRYFQNHPACVPNTTCQNAPVRYGECNLQCPEPSEADR